MKLPARWVGWMLPLFLAGCFHRTRPTSSQQLAPPLAPPQPQTTSVELPPSANTIPPEPTQNAQPKPQQNAHPHHHQPRPPSNNTQEALNAPPPPPPAVSALGQLSSGDPAAYRQQTVDSINSIEWSLNHIGRTLSASEQKTADHIREFLKQARAALASGDVDGAHTLALKAKVLLAELTK